MFTKLVVDVGRALGATVTNSPVEWLLAANGVDSDEMKFGNWVWQILHNLILMQQKGHHTT